LTIRLALTVAAVAAACFSPAVAEGRRAKRAPLTTLELPLLLRVAVCGAKPARTKTWIDAHVAAAAKVFAPHGVKLVARQERFSPARCVLLTRAHRHAMAIHAPADQLTVLVMKRVRDVDVLDYNLMGVHWRYRGKDAKLAGRRWVFLTARARPPVLAHELAHFLGLPHDPVGGNLMTPGPSAPIWKDPAKVKPQPFKPILTRRQARRLRRNLRRWLKARAASAEAATKPVTKPVTKP
jgi:hypothetical protein